jgi:hypothetical protein
VKVIKKHKYAPFSPIRETQFVNDIYREKNVHTMPVLLMQNLTQEQRDKLPPVPTPKVLLRQTLGEKTYKIDLAVDVIGQASGTLAAQGARKYSIKFGDVHEFTSSEDDFETRFALIKSFRPGSDYEGLWAVAGLLQAKSLEYTFFREDNTKIELKPGSALATQVTGSLGVGWTTNQNSSLTFTSPYYIGYRMKRLTNTDKAVDRRLQASSPTGARPVGLIAPWVPVKELRAAATQPQPKSRAR